MKDVFVISQAIMDIDYDSLSGPELCALIFARNYLTKVLDEQVEKRGYEGGIRL